MAFNILSCAFPCCMGQLRHVLVFLCFIAVIIANMHRAVLNIAIVEMVTANKRRNGSVCDPNSQGRPVIEDIGGGKVDWSEKQQQLILSSFFPLYFVMHVPGGIMCDIWGSRHIILWCFVISSVTTGIIPLVAVTCPWWMIMVVRVITGAAQGPILPGISALVASWIPPQERATAGAAIFAANAFGMLAGSLMTGMMIFLLEDWRIPYYLWSGLGLIYVLLHTGYIFSDPRTSPFITDVEMNYLKEMMTFKERHGTPLWPMLKDLCIWGLVAAQVGHGFIIFTLQNNLPKYLNNVLGFSIVPNALTALLFILQWLAGVWFGMISDYAVKKKNANVSWMRKIYTACSNILAGVFMMLMGFMRCNIPMALIMLAIAIFLKGIFFAGMKVNIVDISLNHSALVMALVNGIGAIPGFLGPFVISMIAPNNAHTEWDIVFIGMLVIQVITSFLYALLASSDRRKWDYKEGEAPPAKKKAPHWYLQMSPSDNAARLDANAKADANRKANAAAAKAKMKEEIAAARAARRGT